MTAVATWNNKRDGCLVHNQHHIYGHLQKRWQKYPLCSITNKNMQLQFWGYSGIDLSWTSHNGYFSSYIIVSLFTKYLALLKMMFHRHQHFLKKTRMTTCKTLQFGVGISCHSRSVTAIWGPLSLNIVLLELTYHQRIQVPEMEVRKYLVFGCFRGEFSLA